MNRSTHFIPIVVLALGTSCGDKSPTEPGPEVAAPTYPIELGSARTAQNGGSASVLDIAAPDVNAGDVLIAHVVAAKLAGASTGTPHLICAPAGWSTIRRTNNRADNETSDVAQETFVFVAPAAAPGATHQWSFRSGTCSGAGVNTSAAGAIARFTGVHRTRPIDAHGGNAGTAASPFGTPNVATTVNGAHVLRFVGVSRSTQVSFNGVATLYSVGSSAGGSTTAAAGDFAQSLAGPTQDGGFQFGPAGAHPWVGQTIALRPLHEPSILIRDSFSRTGANGWGAAVVGGPWSVNKSGEFQVDGSMGVVDAVGDSSVYISVSRAPNTYGLNVAGLTAFTVDRLPDGGPQRFHTVQVYARRNDRETDGDNYYRFRVRIFGSRTMDVRIEKTVKAVPSFVTDSVRLATTFSPGARYLLRWEALGTSPATTVRMRVWPEGEPEPTTWHAAAVVDDRDLDYAGTSGYRFQAPTVQLSWPVRFAVDDFLYLQR